MNKHPSPQAADRFVIYAVVVGILVLLAAGAVGGSVLQLAMGCG